MASRLGGTLSRPLSCTVELGEVGVPKQPATQRGQQTIEGVPAHVIQIQPVRSPEAPLIGSLSQHPQPSLFLDASSIADHPAKPVSGHVSRCSFPPPSPPGGIAENVHAVHPSHHP